MERVERKLLVSPYYSRLILLSQKKPFRFSFRSYFGLFNRVNVMGDFWVRVVPRSAKNLISERVAIANTLRLGKVIDDFNQLCSPSIFWFTFISIIMEYLMIIVFASSTFMMTCNTSEETVSYKLD